MRFFKRPMTLERLQKLLPDAAIEEVGDRRELVIYTGLSSAVYYPATDTWDESPVLVPMSDALD